MHEHDDDEARWLQLSEHRTYSSRRDCICICRGDIYELITKLRPLQSQDLAGTEVDAAGLHSIRPLISTSTSVISENRQLTSRSRHNARPRPGLLAMSGVGILTSPLDFGTSASARLRCPPRSDTCALDSAGGCARLHQFSSQYGILLWIEVKSSTVSSHNHNGHPLEHGERYPPILAMTRPSSTAARRQE